MSSVLRMEVSQVLRRLGHGVVGGIILLVLGIVLIGIPIAFAIWAAASIWVIYRVVRGYMLFKDEKPIPGM